MAGEWFFFGRDGQAEPVLQAARARLLKADLDKREQNALACAYARAVGQAPVAVGFGISAPEQAAALAEHADAVVVGSALVTEIDRFGGRTDGPVALVRSLADAVHAVRSS